MKKIIIISLSSLLLASLLIIYPNIEFKKGGKFYACRYSGDIEQFEDELSPDERYGYYKKQDISVNNYKVKKFLFFYLIKMDYIEGNYMDSMYFLEEEYINAVLENAQIIENTGGINLNELLKGKTAIEGNVKYPGNEYDNEIVYKLNGETETLFVYEHGGMVCIQVGNTDEGPKYIAYK